MTATDLEAVLLALDKQPGCQVEISPLWGVPGAIVIVVQGVVLDREGHLVAAAAHEAAEREKRSGRGE